jgi:acyl-ACP thioesterase
MPLQPASSYDYEIDVAADEIDELGHVNNAVYLTWVQAAVLQSTVLPSFYLGPYPYRVAWKAHLC